MGDYLHGGDIFAEVPETHAITHKCMVPPDLDGEEVIATGNPVSVTLAPGILNNIFDGIERPLERIAESGGAFITRGVSVDSLDKEKKVSVDSLDKEKKWAAHITVSVGDYLHGGDIFAEVPETHAITHKCMVPPDLEGTVIQIVEDGAYTIEEPLITLELSSGDQKQLPMAQRWPIRTARPTSHRFPASIPLVTGPTSPFLWETISTAEIFSQKYPKLTRSRINVWYRLIWKEP